VSLFNVSVDKSGGKLGQICAKPHHAWLCLGLPQKSADRVRRADRLATAYAEPI
jgi:hypothetical protein